MNPNEQPTAEISEAAELFLCLTDAERKAVLELVKHILQNSTDDK